MKVWVPQWPNGAWALSRWPRPASQPGHLRGGGGLIEEHQPIRLLAHPGLAVVPLSLAVPRHITATDLGRQQCFFLNRIQFGNRSSTPLIKRRGTAGTFLGLRRTGPWFS